jgi:uncharacterized protein (TIGR02118 family)
MPGISDNGCTSSEAALVASATSTRLVTRAMRRLRYHSPPAGLEAGIRHQGSNRRRGGTMVKLVVAYRPPTDLDEFEQRYRDEHIALAERVPNLQRLALGTVVGTATGGDAPYVRIAELYFEDQAALTAGASSPEGQVAAGHAVEIATGGVDLMIVQVERDG